MLTDQEKIDLVNALDFVVIEPHTQSIYVHNDEKTKRALHKVLHTFSVDDYIKGFKKGNLVDIFPAAMQEAGAEGFKDGQFVIMPKKFYVDQCYAMSKEIERLTQLVELYDIKPNTYRGLIH
ncbi:hypothetical protein [Bacillus inaquosorum]|uniref:hypothetical protein n=1 Tax=Bacillus inaquosorum TaxID=483913 RepID=UPI002DB5B8EB|nr:hypothetical protein [Bacillus inaquosorum]MEC2062628.1 hypothetical protein [Bacillus inaquosorum]MEC2086229.1 hypothetical protein [Bacillus inaquosorum]